MKGANIDPVKKEPIIIKGFGPGNVNENIECHANDPVVLKKTKEATKTIERVGLPGQKN